MSTAKVIDLHSLLPQFEKALRSPVSTIWLSYLAEWVEVVISRCELITAHANGALKELRLIAQKSPIRALKEGEKFRAALEERDKLEASLGTADCGDLFDLNIAAYELAHKFWKLHRELAIVNGQVPKAYRNGNARWDRKHPKPCSTFHDDYIL